MTILSLTSTSRGGVSDDGVYYPAATGAANPFGVAGPFYSTTSVTRHTVGMGAYAFVPSTTWLDYTPGMRVKATSSSTGAWMEGLVTSVASDLLVIEVTSTYGVGTYSDWNINLAGERGVAAPQAGMVVNALLQESHSSGAATFSLATLNGADPSDFDVVRVLYTDGSLGLISAPLSITLPLGASFGVSTNATPFRLWILLVYVSGVSQLAVIQCRKIDDNSVISFPPNGYAGNWGGTAETTAAGQIWMPGGTGSPPFVVVGCAEYDSGLATAGNWGVSPSRILMFGPGMKMPAQPLQTSSYNTGTMVATTSSATILAFPDTIPQINGTSEQVIAVSVTPRSRFSVLDIEAIVQLHCNETTAANVAAALFRTGYQDALAVSAFGGVGDVIQHQILRNVMFTGATSAETFTVRVGKAAAGDSVITMNGYGGVSRLGGVNNSYIKVTEIMT